MTDQALPGSLAERQTEFGVGHGADNGLMNIFNGFDEMGMTQDKVQFFGIFYGYADQFHYMFSPRD
jgi:hypothetical protein